jgi:transposase
VTRELTTIGIDLARNVFAVHAVDRDRRVVLRRLVGRGKLAELIAQLPSASQVCLTIRTDVP